jgi:hypothetical protein
MTGEIIPFPEDRREINKRIYHYKRAGDSFEEIAETLELSSAEVVRGYRAYMTEMVAERSVHERDFIVNEELDRLDQVMKPFLASATQGEKEGAEVYLKVAAHRMKLLKLDQPTPDELKGHTQIIVVTGTKEEFESALREGQLRQVAGPPRDDDEDEEAK